MRLFITTIFLLIQYYVIAQENAASDYDEVSDFKIGDAFHFNEPTNNEEYRSVYYTYEAAKNIRPDLKPYSTEKIYLSSQFYKAPFTIVTISGNEATLAYGIMKNFAIMDLEMAIRSGEVGNKANMAPIWLIDEIKKGDPVQLRNVAGNGEYQSIYYTPKFAKKELNKKGTEKVYLNDEYVGDILKVVKRWDDIALLTNDTIKEIAFVDLKEAIAKEEIEIRANHFLTIDAINQLSEEGLVELEDSLLYTLPVDTVKKVSFLDKWGLGIYVAPLMELSTKESSSFAFGGALGVIIKEKWQVGAYIQKYNGGLNDLLIFPNSFVFDYTYAGYFAAYPLMQKGKLTVLAEAKIGLGEAAWSTEETTEVLDSDRFSVFNPRIGIDYKMSKIGILNLSLGYRMVNGFDLTELGGSELSDLNVSLMLKIGRFNKKVDE